MLQKSFLSKILKTFYFLVIFGGFLSSVLTSSWAMEQHKEEWEEEPLTSRGNHKIHEAEKFSHIEQLPSEVGQHIFYFLPLESYEHVRRVCKTFNMWAQDEQGPFKDLIAFRSTYKAQNAELLRQNSDINLFSQALSDMRTALQILRHRPLEEQRAFAVQLLNELKKNKGIQLNNLTDKPKNQTGYLGAIWWPLTWLSDKLLTSPTHEALEERPEDEVRDLRTIWVSLAWVRACDKLLPDSMQWLEETVLPSLMRQGPMQKALVLLDNESILREEFTFYAKQLRTGHNALDTKAKQNPFAKELCERGCESIKTVLRAAATSLELKDWGSAATYYTLVLEKDPTLSAKIYVNAALSHLILEHDQEAVEYYAIAFAKDCELSAADYLNAAGACFNLKNYPLAAKYYTLALEKGFTFFAQDYVNAAVAHYSLEDYQLAARYFTAAIEKDPTLSALICVCAGDAYRNLRDNQMAAKYYTLAIEKDPTLPTTTYIDAALAYYSLKDYQLAAKYFVIALEKDPTLPAYECTGNAYRNLGDNKLAAKYYTLALEKDPTLPAYIYVYAADGYHKLRDYQLALKYYTLALEKDPTSPARTYLNAGYYAAKANELERAKIYFEKFINHQNITKLEIKLLPDTLNIIEDVLTTTKSDVPFREWINLKRNKDFQEIPSQK